MMSGIRGSNTRPELIVRSFLHRAGLRYRLHVRSLPGSPDIVLARYQAVVEVRGCFWHRHPGCQFASTPASNRSFWKEKFRENVMRDRRTEKELMALGWRVFTVWECEIADRVKLQAMVRRIRRRA
jgi:DNA mismatch endonuclease (patch repair protein)